MTARIRLWLALLAAQSLVLTGCSTRSHPHAKVPTSPTTKGSPAQKVERLSDGDMERRIRAHAHFAAGLAHDLDGKPDKALEDYYQAALADPGYEPTVLESSRRFLHSKQYDKAIQVLKKAAALPDAPGNIFAWLGLAYAQAGKKEDAIKANRIAIRKAPQSLAPYQNLAQLSLQNSRTNEAFQVLNEAGRQSLRDPAFFIDLSALYFQFGRRQPTKADEAKERAKAMLERAEKLKPDSPILLQRLGEGYLLLGDFSSAERIYSRMLKEFPDVPALRVKLAEIYVRNGQNAKATEQFEAIAREDPTNPQTHFLIGSLALEQKQPEKAAEAFDRAILLNPDFEPAYYDLTAAKLNLKKNDEAWGVLEKAHARFKLNFVLEYYSGMVRSALKDYAGAVQHFISAELLAKTTEPARLNHLFYFQFGAACERHGSYEDAEKLFRKSLELSPKFSEAMNYLGYMWVERGVKLDEARKLIQDAVEIEPKNAAFLDSLGWAFFKLNKPEEALPWMLKAVEHSEEPDATLFDHLGDIYSALKKADQARDAWRKSLAVEPNDKIKAKLDATPPGGARPAP
jgi:tetratricopeptide (TPR) repeat protein